MKSLDTIFKVSNTREESIKFPLYINKYGYLLLYEDKISLEIIKFIFICKSIVSKSILIEYFCYKPTNSLSKPALYKRLELLEHFYLIKTHSKTTISLTSQSYSLMLESKSSLRLKTRGDSLRVIEKNTRFIYNTLLISELSQEYFEMLTCIRHKELIEKNIYYVNPYTCTIQISKVTNQSEIKSCINKILTYGKFNINFKEDIIPQDCLEDMFTIFIPEEVYKSKIKLIDSLIVGFHVRVLPL